MTQITLSELPETLQNFLKQAQTTGEILTITQNGIPCATISPIKKSKRAALGAMKNTGKIVGDIVEPIFENNHILKEKLKKLNNKK